MKIFRQMVLIFLSYRNQLYHLQNTCKFFARLNGSLAQVIHTNFEENFRLKRGKGNTSEGTKISTIKVFTQKNILAQPIGQEKKFLGAKTLDLEMWRAVESVWVSRVGNSPKVVCYFNSVKIQVYQIILSTWLG